MASGRKKKKSGFGVSPAYDSAWLNDRERVARDLQAFQTSAMSGRLPDQPWSDHRTSQELRAAHREARKLRPTVHHGIDGSTTYKVRGQVVKVVDRKGRTKYNRFQGASPFDVSDVYGLGLVSAFGPPTGDGSLGRRSGTQSTQQSTQQSPWYSGMAKRADELVNGFTYSTNGFGKANGGDKEVAGYEGYEGFGSEQDRETRVFEAATMAASHTDVDQYGRRLKLTPEQSVARRHDEMEARVRARELGIAYTGGTMADVEEEYQRRQAYLDSRKKETQQAARGGRTMSVFRRAR